MNNALVFNTGSYFEWHMKLVGGVFAIIGFAWIFENVFGGAILVFGGLTTFFTNYYFMINPQQKWYRHGVSVMGVKSGVKTQYQHVEYLFVKPNKVTRTYNSRIQSAAVTDVEFDSYIRFSEHEKVHLFSAKEKQRVIDKLVPLSNLLRVQILDYTREVSDVI